MGQSECKGWSHADPASDTVKFEPTLLGAKPPSLKVQRSQWSGPGSPEPDPEDEFELEDKGDDEAIKFAEACAAEANRVAAALAEEKTRLAAEEEAKARRVAEAAALAAARAAAASIAKREAEEQAERSRLAAAAREKREAEAVVAMYLKQRGFRAIGQPRRKVLKKRYPLHVAVEENSPAIVRALLLCRADKSVKNSSEKTPRELAELLNKDGSHDAVIALLKHL